MTPILFKYGADDYVSKICKAYIGFVFSLLTLIFLSPLFLVIYVAVMATSKGPVFFKQRRIGQYKKEFFILKFRTMKIETPKDMPTHLLKNPKIYLTPIGDFLRKTSLDELPQLLNILFGDMSIVGPRPALWNQYDLIAQRDLYGANNVPVGLTGLAQINGRDELPVPIKAKFDGEYAKNITLAKDLAIFFKTFAKVFKKENIT